ncbi:MAG: M13 family metallopeptidase, partial [Candidatus Eremiobacteraeota bacterium]|nr:M13 family metallopeptidase [Candidatus Eremiobacteraeota bacterium]
MKITGLNTYVPTTRAAAAPAAQAQPEAAPAADTFEATKSQAPATSTPAAPLAATAGQTAVKVALSSGLQGPLAVVLAQQGVRSVEQKETPASRATVGKVYLQTLAGQTFDPEAAAEARQTLDLTSSHGSGAGAAYLTTLRDIAMRDAQAVPGTGFDLGSRDTTTRPQDNFYQHVNGGWIANNPIPSDQSRWGRFNELRDASTRIQKEILEEYAGRSDFPQGTVEQKLGDFYYSGMDTDTIEAAGLTPIQPLLDRINAVSDTASLQGAIADFHNQGLPGFFEFGSTADSKNSTQTIGAAYQGGLGLPAKAYYVKQDEKSISIRQAYQAHVGKMFELMGDDQQTAATKAEKVMAIETRLAEASLDPADLRDPEGTYHIMNREELNALTPNFNWDNYLDSRGLQNLETLDMATPKFFQALDTALVDTPVEDWKAYLQWNVINSTANALPARFDEQDFDFYGKTLGGVEQRPPRWKRIAQSTSGTLGMALGKAYVERAFPPEAKARAQEMIENIRGAIGQHVRSLDWMSDATKEQALEKLSTVAVKVGYPDEWPTYDGLDVDRSAYANNVLRARAFASAEDIAKIGKPVDRSEWGMSPATVNAYYNPLNNEIVFPAAILQPPFFDANADDPINYGGIGVVIGHEFTHGFDDQGAQFDAQGNLRNWWTDEDLHKFEERAGVIKNQANNYEVEPGLHLNGDLVLGESLADLGGVNLSLTALQNSLAGSSFDTKVEGFT